MVIAECHAAGAPAGTHLLVTLEDERLVGMTAEDLGWLLEEHRRVAPAVREQGRRSVYLDEVQVVSPFGRRKAPARVIGRSSSEGTWTSWCTGM